MRAGHAPAMVGAHAVGVADGGPGLPVTRWSTEGGDLRVPHFIGIHALQLLPLVGWRLGRRGRGSAAGAARAARLTVVAGAGMIGLVAVTLVQALRGIPRWPPTRHRRAGAGVVAGCGLVAAWPARACARRCPPGAARVTAHATWAGRSRKVGRSRRPPAAPPRPDPRVRRRRRWRRADRLRTTTYRPTEPRPALGPGVPSTRVDPRRGRQGRGACCARSNRR